MNHRNLLSSYRVIFSNKITCLACFIVGAMSLSGNAFAQTSPVGLARNALTFERFYNSMATTPYAGTFAQEFGNAGWRHIYDRYVKVTSSSGTVTFIAAERADGQVLPFTPNGSAGSINHAGTQLFRVALARPPW